MTPNIAENVPLAPLTTLGIGGKAEFYCDARTRLEALAALDWASKRDSAVYILGGGSNLLIADRGVRGLVLRMRNQEITPLDDRTVDVDAGVEWDRFVAWTVSRDVAGVECLSGIPGDTGAAPIQNIGAYGQELSESLVHVEAVDRESGKIVTIDSDTCELRYRDSLFKSKEPGRYLVTRVRFQLRPGDPPKVAYRELERAMEGRESSLQVLRDTIIALRRKKSMVLDPGDENGQSAGSFFVNPTIAAGDLESVRARVLAVAPNETMPSYDAPDDRVKLSAAWLIERAGMTKGTVRGRVGISTRHSLALVNRGGATAEELLVLADEVRKRVGDAFGVQLHAEPRMVGFTDDELAPFAANSGAAAAATR